MLLLMTDKARQSMSTNRRLQHIVLAALCAAAALVYLPGVSGPWLFDDYGVLIKNTYVRVTKLDLDSLWHAAFSVETGPLKRPISMLTFALNYYFAGSFRQVAHFKATNIAIHATNSVLIFFLLRAALNRAISTGQVGLKLDSRLLAPGYLAAAVAILWSVHPIQLTSVLYVVQRMAALSALFTLLALITYLRGRTLLVAGNTYGWRWVGLATPAFGLLGILSKENAILLPVFIVALEYTLFRDEKPWSFWSQLPIRDKQAIAIIAAVVSIFALIWVFQFALTGYGNRPFTLAERAFTETRVLFFYLSLILVPRINRFGLHHDDIALSTSLLSPWTTVPALLGLISLVFAAFILVKRHPLLSLGILWFFAGHLLESTILPLEIAHEHRNYVASLGPILAFVYLVTYGAQRIGQPRLLLIVPVFMIAFIGTSITRASQWATPASLFAFEALHHPNSAIANGYAAGVLTLHGHYEEAAKAHWRAAELEPFEASHLMWLAVLAARQDKDPDPSLQSKILHLLSTTKLSATTMSTLGDAASCIQSWCKRLQIPLEQWAKTLIERPDRLGDKSYFYYLLGLSYGSQGRYEQATAAFEISHRLDPSYLHPLFNLAAIHVQFRRLEEAEQVLRKLRSANMNSLHPRNREVAAVARDVEKLKAALKSQVREGASSDG